MVDLRREFPELEPVLVTGKIDGSELVRLYRRHVEQWRRYSHALVPAFLPLADQHMLSA